MFKRTLLVLILVLFSLPPGSVVEGAEKPNILWIIVDDMSAQFSSYGEEIIETPNVDALAGRGVQFNNAFVTAPVCSTCRSAFITGMYQTTIGAHHHRSGRGTEKIILPEGVRPLPEIFQEAGYYTTLAGWPIRADERLGKSDYNFEWDQRMYHGADWARRKDGQPFFAQIQLPGGKLRGGTQESAERMAARAEKTFGNRTDIKQVSLPPYYPATDVILHDWAAYLDTVRETDRVVGEILAKLQEEGDFENTIVVFMTDHGISHIRGKQFMYDEGLHVPLVIAGPGVKEGQVRDDLVEHIDIAAVSLASAGIKIPKYMQAQNIMSEVYRPRRAVYAARDRCDETVEHLRSVRTQDFKYIRNYLHQRPHLQPNAYKDGKSIMKSFRAAGANGQLNQVQAYLLNASRPEEELYDLHNDPHEVNNLADDPAYAGVLKQMRKLLSRWETKSADQGVAPEPAIMFDSDMKVYVDTLEARRRPIEHINTIKNNIELMRKWAGEGK
ncbi:MAG: sulfatase [Planctomycetaceae bacterium]|nr:sulfatase [Planctomycetaceae bacterium]|tara:strand:+ start:3277 stop:4773 length:1497 start_codon:yes stop_codon:yes gene_type:complete